MKKKIGLGIIATMLVAGAFVFAGNASQQDSSICPDRPGCICPSAKTEQAVQQNATDNEDFCDPYCICK